MVSNEKRFQLDRRPLCTDGIIASFFLSTWPYYSVGCIGLVRVEYSSFITAFGSLIAIYPDEPSCKQGIGTPAIPKVAQAGSSSLIVHGVHKFGRHEYFITIGETCYPCQISRIVMRIQVVKVSPGMYHMSFL